MTRDRKTIEVDHDTHAELAALAEERGVSIRDTVATLIDWALAEVDQIPFTATPRASPVRTKPPKPREPTVWGPYKRADVRRWRRQGRSLSNIAHILGTTRSAVAGACSRYGL